LERRVIPLAYGTYGLAAFSPWESIDLIAASGYSGIELTLAEGYRNAGTRMSASETHQTKERLEATGLALVAVLARLEVLDASGTPRPATRGQLREIIASGQALSATDQLIVTFTMGGRTGNWPQGRAELVDELGQLGAIAASEGAVLAVEAHVGGLVDRPDRVHWLIQQVGLDSVRINFDISHFALPGTNYDTLGLIRELLPLAVHAHVKDSIATSDGFRFVLPGSGSFDYTQYFAGLMASGWERPVTVEVSAMVFGQPDYDPLRAMDSSYRALADALAQAQTLAALAHNGGNE
jgi:sugar phosphate isomerase/epimerase